MRTPGLGRWSLAMGGIAVLFSCCGCQTQGSGSSGLGRVSAGEFQSQRLANVELAAVRQAADRSFRQYFRLNGEASSPDVWVSVPTEMTHQDQFRRVRDALAVSRNSHRQLARLVLVQQGADVVARCHVTVQRLDTAERAAFATERGDDRPTDTPIDRQGASSTNAREEWVNIGRDRATERMVLDSILERISKTPANQ